MAKFYRVLAAVIIGAISLQLCEKSVVEAYALTPAGSISFATVWAFGWLLCSYVAWFPLELLRQIGENKR